MLYQKTKFFVIIVKEMESPVFGNGMNPILDSIAETIKKNSSEFQPNIQSPGLPPQSPICANSSDSEAEETDSKHMLSASSDNRELLEILNKNRADMINNILQNDVLMNYCRAEVGFRAASEAKSGAIQKREELKEKLLPLLKSQATNRVDLSLLPKEIVDEIRGMQTIKLLTKEFRPVPAKLTIENIRMAIITGLRNEFDQGDAESIETIDRWISEYMKTLPLQTKPPAEYVVCNYKKSNSKKRPPVPTFESPPKAKRARHEIQQTSPLPSGEPPSPINPATTLTADAKSELIVHLQNQFA